MARVPLRVSLGAQPRASSVALPRQASRDYPIQPGVSYASMRLVRVSLQREPMHEQVAEMLHEAEHRIDRQIRRIRELEGAGHWSDAARAREMLAVITETCDAFRLRLRVVQEVVVTQERSQVSARTRWACG